MKSRALSSARARAAFARGISAGPAGGEPVDPRRRRVLDEELVVDASRATGRAGAARCRAAPGCCAWSAPGGCAGTSRTRSGRCRSTFSSRSSSTSSSAAGASAAASAKAGSHCSVTVAMTPSAPSPTRAAANRSGAASASQCSDCRRRARARSAAHLGGEAAELRAGAVRAGRDRAGDGLHVDVAEVGHRQAEVPQRLVELVQPGAGEHGDQARSRGRRGRCRRAGRGAAARRRWRRSR